MKKLSECTVLAVDDTEENIDILVDALGDDYEISVALDGFSALEVVNEDPPDIILLDIMMPEMSGYEVCDRIKSNPARAGIPIIFLSAMSDIESKTYGFQHGGVDYITKPFDILEVKARIKTHLSLQLAKMELSLQNQLLEEKVKERTQELYMTQEVTIEAMAYLGEYRDPETGWHIKKTKNYVKLLATKLMEKPKFHEQLNTEIINILYESAPLHDIGKIGIRDDVLLKPGKLTETEFEEMKAHTVIGYNAIKQAAEKLGDNSFLQYAMEFARYHQEKWDGSGYPFGLKGEEIPLSGRIMALADVYDALISKRTYKPPFTHQKAMSIIMESRGSHFDPDIVDAFLEINEEFRNIAIHFAAFEEELLVLCQE